MMMVTSVVAVAGTSGYKTYSNGSYYIDCYISCNSSTGVGKTKGAPTGKYNRAVIIIYNSNGVELSFGNKQFFSTRGRTV